jgi:hypothetical protein
VGRLLAEADLKPHQSQYWLNPPPDPRVIASYLLQKIQTKREKYSVKKKQSSKRRKGYYLKKVSE